MSTLDFDPEDMTIEEIEEVETRTGESLEQLFASLAEKKMPSAKQLRAIAFVLSRRSDPTFTWEQAGTLKLGAMYEVVGSSGPTTAVGTTSN